MPATALTVQTTSRTGAAVTLVAPDGGNGNSFVNTGQEVLLVDTGAAIGKLTVATTAEVDGLAVADRTLTTASASLYHWGPWPVGVYGATPTITYSGTTLTIAAIKVVKA